MDQLLLTKASAVKRRHFIHLGMTSLASCGKERRASGVSINAGPFSVTVPENWSKTAIVEKVPIRPLYSREQWEDYQNDDQFSLIPGYNCRPQHWAIRLPAALPSGISFFRNSAGDDPTAPQILIHKADEWSLVFTDGEHEEKKGADALHSLRRKMDTFMIDGNGNFGWLKQRIDFSGGHGVRLLVQWTVEPTPMRFGELHYLFLGMSDDNSCQIIATFPIDLPGLPRPDDNNHLGHNFENYAEFQANFDNYCEDAGKWLVKNEKEITPSIGTLDQLMQSLNAFHWK